MEQEQLKIFFDQLADHEARIVKLEGGESKKSISIKEELTKEAAKPNKSKGKGEDLVPPIQKLVTASFFKEPKIDQDVVSELQKRLLTRKTPLRPSVVNVLRKMVRSEVLKRVDVVKGKKTLIAYQNF
jgi:hypothetical protein